MIIPVKDFRGDLQQTVNSIMQATYGASEVLVVENGSWDWNGKLSFARYWNTDDGGFGKALTMGLKLADNEKCIFLPADGAYGLSFIGEALEALDRYDVVVGSKFHRESHVERPWWRKANSQVYVDMQKRLFSLDTGDVSGAKGWRRSKVLPIAEHCQEKGFLFDVELQYKCEAAGLSTVDIPVKVRDYGRSAFGVGSVFAALKQLRELKSRLERERAIGY